MGSTSKSIEEQGVSQKRTRFTDALAHFSWSFLGLAAIRVWIQCTMYDRYAFTDAGATSVTINLLRAAFTGLMVLIVLKVGFPARFRVLMEWFSVTAMTSASILFLLDSQLVAFDADFVACVLAGAGIVWGGGAWMEFYLRLEPDESLTYALLSLALGSACGLVLGFLSSSVGTMISMIMPTVSFVTLKRAMHATDTGTKGFAHVERLDPAPVDTRYDREPRRTWLRLLTGLALFEFAIGVARGFPFGESFEMAPAFQILHQMAVVGASFAMLFLVLAKDRFIRYSTLWRMALALVALGIILLATLDDTGMAFGSACIAIVNSVMLGLLWYTCYDIARHCSIIPYAVLGICWFVFLLAREAGRWFVMSLPPHGDAIALIDVLMIILLSISIAVMFGDNIPRTREFFEDLRTRMLHHAHGTLRIEEPSREQVDLIAMYGLTPREAEVIDGMMKGKSKAAIGGELFISENTVRGYVKNAYAKMNVHNKEQLEVKYYRF